MSAKLLTHAWIGRRFLPERYGQRCRVLVSRRGKHLIQFEDGTKTVTVRGTFQRIKSDPPRTAR